MQKKKQAVAKRFGTKTRLVALATMAACAAVVKQGANGQTLVAEMPKDPTPAQLPVRRFHIVEGPLDSALDAYRAQSGVRLKLDITADQLAGFRTAGVSGLFEPDAALRQLLSGTGLSYKFAGAESASVGLHYGESVDVNASLPDAVALTHFLEPLLDTPQTVSVVPQFILHDEGNRTLTDAIRNVPGISIAAGESGAQGDNLTIRGFTARNDIFLDGIRDFGSYYRDSFNYDQVEVLEGPAGVQFGRGSTGGIINQESKVPAQGKFVDVQAQVGTDATRRVTADINAPLSDNINGPALRVNAVGTEGGVAGRPFAENRRFGVAPSISFGLNKPTRLTISYFHFTESDTPDYGLPWFFNQLAPGVNRHSYYGFADENFLRTNDDIITLKANHTFKNNVDIHTIGRWANYPRNAQITEPQICSNASASVPVGGYVSALPTSSVTGAVCPYTPGNVNPANVLVNRNQLQIKSVEGDLWDQTEVTAHFKVAGVRNDFNAGVEGGREVSNPIRTNYNIKAPGTSTALNTVPYTTLLNPNTSQPFAGTGYILSVAHATAKSVGLYFVDTMKLGRLFELSGGVRWDHFDTVYSLYQPTPPPAGGTVTAPVLNADGTPLRRVDEQPTYRAAFVYKPSSRGSVYFDYGTSFNPSAESLSLSIGSAAPASVPEENETYEAGAKWNFFNERLRMEGAVFRTEKDNARETDPTNSNNIVAAGNQVVRGVQASVVGQLPHGMDVIAGYAYLDGKTIYSKFFPTSVGYQLANVPRNTFNAFITRKLGLNLTGGFGGNYVGPRTASSTVPYVPIAFGPGPSVRMRVRHRVIRRLQPSVNCYPVLATAMKQVAGYWVFNAMVRRPVTDKIELQANVYNLLNRFFIDQPHPSHLIPAAGLSALIGANFRF